MYLDALEFLEEERDEWAPYEALADLSDEDLERPTDPDGPARGWTGRDLAGHIVAWLEVALGIARDLAVGEQSRTSAEIDAAWEAEGDALNERLMATWRALPLDEVRRRIREVPGELRGTLTVVPEARWIKSPERMETFVGETIEHYQEHRPELAAILAAAGR